MDALATSPNLSTNQPKSSTMHQRANAQHPRPSAAKNSVKAGHSPWAACELLACKEPIIPQPVRSGGARTDSACAAQRCSQRSLLQERDGPGKQRSCVGACAGRPAGRSSQIAQQPAGLSECGHRVRSRAVQPGRRWGWTNQHRYRVDSGSLRLEAAGTAMETVLPSAGAEWVPWGELT